MAGDAPPVGSMSGQRAETLPRPWSARVDERLTRAVAHAACLCLSVAVAAGFWQVVTRFVLGDPAVWSEALVRLALVWSVLLGFAVAVREGALVSIDLVGHLVPDRLLAVVRVAVLAATLAVCAVLGGFGVTMAIRVARQTLAGLEISIAWGYAAIPVGCAFTALGAIARHVERAREPVEPSQ